MRMPADAGLCSSHSLGGRGRQVGLIQQQRIKGKKVSKKALHMPLDHHDGQAAHATEPMEEDEHSSVQQPPEAANCIQNLAGKSMCVR